jgi:hypothetical protein
LQEAGLPAKGEGRLFLDRLANILRRYLVGRYCIGASEMTSQEVAESMRRRGYGEQEARAFSELLRMCDERRYGPSSIDGAFCRTLLRSALQLLARVRIVARFTTVPARLAVEGQKCWSRLRELPGLHLAEGDSLAREEVSGD